MLFKALEVDGQLYCPFCHGPVTHNGINDDMCDDTSCGWWSNSEYEPEGE